MVSCLHGHAAVVAVVDKLVPSLRVEFIQHGHGGVLGSPQRRELPMSLPGHRKESVSPIHQITRYDVVGISRTWHRRGNGRRRVEEDSEEDVLVLLHGLVDLVGEVVSSYQRAAFLASLLTTPFVSLVISLLRCLTIEKTGERGKIIYKAYYSRPSFI